MFNLHRLGLESYAEILKFLKGFNPSISLTEHSIALLKYRSLKWRTVARIKQSDEFVKYILKKFKDFDLKSFYRQY